MRRLLCGAVFWALVCAPAFGAVTTVQSQGSPTTTGSTFTIGPSSPTTGDLLVGVMSFTTGLPTGTCVVKDSGGNTLSSLNVSGSFSEAYIVYEAAPPSITNTLTVSSCTTAASYAWAGAEFSGATTTLAASANGTSTSSTLITSTIASLSAGGLSVCAATANNSFEGSALTIDGMAVSALGNPKAGGYYLNASAISSYSCTGFPDSSGGAAAMAAFQGVITPGISGGFTGYDPLFEELVRSV